MVTDVNLLKRQLKESVDTIRDWTGAVPKTGIILGTGLGDLAKHIIGETVIPYENIPHFPLSTVEFHKGKLIFGTLSNTEIVAMQGRFHFYEGYSMQEITYPVRVMHQLGINTLIISNASGSMNQNIRNSNIMLVEDHINLLGNNPLRGINDKFFGPRFVDMSEPYSLRLINLAEKTAKENNIPLFKGVYAAMTGPNLETKAEYKFLKLIGADVVGMSTVPETIVARQLGIEVICFSVVTDECYPETLKPINVNDVLNNAAKAEPELTILIKGLLNKI